VLLNFIVFLHFPLSSCIISFIDDNELPAQYCADGKIEKNEVGGACGAHGGGERCAQSSSGVTRGKEAIGETRTYMGG